MKSPSKVVPNSRSDCRHHGSLVTAFTVCIKKPGHCGMNFSFKNLNSNNQQLLNDFVYNLQTFRGFCQVHFTILLQIQHENNVPPTSEHRQGKVRRFLGICLFDCFIYRTNFVLSRNETPSWLRSQNSELPRIFRVTGANQNARKLLFTDLVKTKNGCLVQQIFFKQQLSSVE